MNKITNSMGVVIMAGGVGSRMRCSSVHKVCFPLGGKPVINRNIEMFNRNGINTHFIVVKHLAEQVMQTVSSTQGTHFFCYQKESKGTGNAAKTAANIISKIPSIKDILVIAGDKVIEEDTLKKFIDEYHKSGNDLMFIAGDIKDFPNSGRVIYTKKDSIAGILEVFDIKKFEILQELKKFTEKNVLSAEKTKKIIFSFLKDEKKIDLALKPLWHHIKLGKNVTSEFLKESFKKEDFSLRCNNTQISPLLLKKVKYANLSVYLFKREAFLSSVTKIRDDNAQKEEYLTDTIGILAEKKAKINIMPIENPNQVMAFNTPEDINEIEKYLVQKNFILKETPSYFRRPLDWLRHLETSSPASIKYFKGIYGNNYPFIENKKKMLTAAIKDYLEYFGNNPVLISRAPGRINVMGRHIDHQGGDVNMVAIDKDIYSIIGKRNDKQVFANSIEPYKFSEKQFSIDNLGVDIKKDWGEFINSSFVLKQISSAKKDWGRYVKAVLSRFQHFSGKIPIKGMNIMVTGDLPIEGGISSSSALFMSISEGCAFLNNFTLSPYKFVELCDEGECFLGNRGGTGDHAAIKYSKQGYITQIGLSPLQIIKTVPFPKDYFLVMCNSQYQAYKTKGTKNIYNHRVTCYHIGKDILEQNFPFINDFVVHLRDIVYGKGNLSEKDIFGMLKSLPLSMSRAEVKKKIQSEQVKKNLQTIPMSIDIFPIREILMYGFAESIRSKYSSELLLKNEVAKFGQLMNISHNGDRVSYWTKRNGYTPFSVDYSDATMDSLILNSDKNQSQLIFQPGGYRCSIQDIDKMVDISKGIKHVAGAQISGAGLGGYIMSLVKEEAYEQLEEEMLQHYYEPLNFEQEIFIAYPSEGSGLVYF